MAPKQNTLFFFYEETLAGEVWLDENFNFVNVIHENDGHWSSYLDFVAGHFGGNVVQLSLDDEEIDFEFDGADDLDFEELAQAFVKHNIGAIRRAAR